MALGAVRTAALGVLSAVAASLKGALGHAADGAHRARPPPFDAAHPGTHTQCPAALSYPPPPGGLAQGPGHATGAAGATGVGHATAAAGASLYSAAVAAAESAPLPTLPVAHLIATVVIPLLAVPNVAGDALLVLKEVLPLLELTPTSAHHEQADPGEGVNVVNVRAISRRLGIYTTAIDAALSSAAAGVSLNGDNDLLPTGECPVFFPALALVALMVATAGQAAAAAAVKASAMPRRLTDRLEATATDELLAAVVPGLRTGALAALAALGAPAAAAACAAVEAAARGMSAATAGASDSTPLAAALWAREVLPALDFIAEDEAGPLAAQLVSTILTATAAHLGGAGVIEAQRRSCAEGLEAAQAAVRDLIRHRSEATRTGAYAALVAAAEMSGTGPGSGLETRRSAAAFVAEAAQAVIAGSGVTAEIIAGGLARADTRVAAAACLGVIAKSAGQRRVGGSGVLGDGTPIPGTAASLLPWLPWLECDLDDEVVGPAAAAAAAAAVRTAPAKTWTPLEPLLRGLFHRAARRRAAAAQGLVRAMGLRPPAPPLPPQQHVSEAARAWVDPFGSMLRYNDSCSREIGSPLSAAAAAATVPGNGTHHGASYSSPGFYAASSASSVFSSRDVHDLVKVVTGASLGAGVRCAAAEQLCICATDRRLEQSIAAPSTLAALARVAASALEGVGLDADVGAAALRVVAAAVTHSPAARRFFAAVAPIAAADGVSSRDEHEWQPYGKP